MQLGVRVSESLLDTLGSFAKEESFVVGWINVSAAIDLSSFQVLVYGVLFSIITFRISLSHETLGNPINVSETRWSVIFRTVVHSAWKKILSWSIWYRVVEGTIFVTLFSMWRSQWVKELLLINWSQFLNSFSDHIVIRMSHEVVHIGGLVKLVLNHI